MGVLGLFRTLIQKYSNTLNCNTNYTSNYLFLDYNSLVHGCKGKYMSPNNPNIDKILKMSQTTIENNIIKEVINYTKHIVDYVKPDTVLYIAIDGSVPFAKMHLQRERRFKAIVEEQHKKQLQEKHGITNTEIWSSTNITPGTKFMAKLSSELKKAIQKGTFSGHSNKPIEIILSDSNVPGEGETKIFEYIRNTNIKANAKICIYGLDADLIMLSIASKRSNIQLIRELKDSKIELELYGDCELIYFNIDNLMASLMNEYQLQDMDIYRFINDFICITCLAGNDFVKKIFFLENNPRPEKDAWNILLNIYLNIKRGGSDYLITITENKKLPVEINQQFLTQFFTALSDIEQYHLTGKQMKINKLKDRRDNRVKPNDADKTPYELELAHYEHDLYINPDNPFYERYRGNFDVINFSNRVNNKKQYYQHFFGLDTSNAKEYNNYRRLITLHYLESLLWTINYYLAGILSWGFYYRFRVAPFVSDIKLNLSSISNINKVLKFTMGKPYKPLHQLMMVTPPQQKKILPAKYGDLMVSKKSPIAKYYPLTVMLDTVSGMKHIKSHALLPHIDDTKIISLLNKVDATLPAVDKKRNILKTNPEIFIV